MKYYIITFKKNYNNYIYSKQYVKFERKKQK